MPTPPPKRKKIEDDSAEISDVLQGEIARLDQKFKVQLDPIQHMGSRTVNLICQLGKSFLTFPYLYVCGRGRGILFQLMLNCFYRLEI